MILNRRDFLKSTLAIAALVVVSPAEATNKISYVLSFGSFLCVCHGEGDSGGVLRCECPPRQCTVGPSSSSHRRKNIASRRSSTRR